MNEWEIIGRFVDLDNRLRTLEGRPTVQEKPQPVATGLCEDIEILLKHFDDYFSGVALESFKSGNDADTNLGFVRKMKRVLIGNNPTTPGGDDGK